MNEQIKLIRELRVYFPKASIRQMGADVAIIQGVFYTCDRRELSRLQKKYNAMLWCDVLEDKVHFHFHDIGCAIQ